MRALDLLGLADSTGATDLPLYVLNVTYPLIDGEGRRVLPRQEGRADRRGRSAEFIEQGLCDQILRKADVAHARARQGRVAAGWRVHGRCDSAGLRGFMRAYSPEQLERANARLPPPPAELPKEVQALASLLPSPAARLLHGLPRATDLYRDEAGTA